jgi:hypothetical protein
MLASIEEDKLISDQNKEKKHYFAGQAVSEG